MGDGTSSSNSPPFVGVADATDDGASSPVPDLEEDLDYVDDDNDTPRSAVPPAARPVPPAPATGEQIAAVAPRPRQDIMRAEILNPNGVPRGAIQVPPSMSGAELVELCLRDLFHIKAQFAGLFDLAWDRPEGFSQWVNRNEPIGSQSLPETPRLIMRPRLMFRFQEIDDEAALTLFWLHVLVCVVGGFYVLDEGSLVHLAALYLQVCDGDFPASAKANRFRKDSLRLMLPSRMFHSYNPRHMEIRLPRAHRRLLGMRRKEALREYLRTAAASPLYGAAVFHGMSMDTGRSSSVAVVEDGVMLALNIEKKDVRERDWQFFPWSTGASVAREEADQRCLLISSGMGDAPFTLVLHRDAVCECLRIAADFRARLGAPLKEQAGSSGAPVAPEHLGFVAAAALVAKEAQGMRVEPVGRVPLSRMWEFRFSAVEMLKRVYLNNAHKLGIAVVDALVLQLDRALDEQHILTTLDLSVLRGGGPALLQPLANAIRFLNTFVYVWKGWHCVAPHN
jgi:hypothetical protein